MRPFAAALAVVIALPLAAPALAQGRASDYARAAGLRARWQGHVYRARVSPHWLDGGERFWYRNDLPGGRREFILVDAAKGQRGPAFDHRRVAQAMAKALGVPVEASKLPVDAIDYRNGGLLLRAGRAVYEFDEASGAVRGRASEGSDADALRPLPRLRPSGDAGDETEIVFVNQTGVEIGLYWVDGGGARQPYGKLAAGQRRRQHTFAGHVWVACDSAGTALAAFRAEVSARTAIVAAGARLAAGPEPAGPAAPPGLRSPDGNFVAAIREHNVWVRATTDGGWVQLTREGSAADSYEEPLAWSPDSRRLAALRVVPAQEHKVHIVQSSPADQLQPKLITLDYLKPGDRIAHPRPRLIDVAGRREIPIAETLFPTPWEIDEIRWAADSSRFTFAYNQRGHQALRIIAVDAGTGATSAIIDERSPTFIDYAGKRFVHYADATGEIIWSSERDGWRHLYLIDARTGAVKSQITRGPWVVRGVDRVDEGKRQIWFQASGIDPKQDPYHVHFCRVNFDGSGLTRLTEGDGTHSVEYSPDGRYLVDTWSRVDLPPVTELRRASDGARVCALEQSDITELTAAGWVAPERFTAKGRDGATDIWGVIVRPTTFRRDRRYPVIESIYAGPQSSYTPKAFSPMLGYQELAELGFVVVQMDGMGTSNRSKAFHDVCWKNLADAGFPDRILWMKAAAAKRPWMDLSRVGIYGGSAGGQNALGGLLTHPEFYSVGVADCGCHDNRMDKIWWNELWMGWPLGPHYAEQSNVTLAPKLQGKLLLMVGEIDSNVDPASTMQVANALIKADKDFDLLVMPNVGHGAAGPAYGARRLRDFFVRHLLGVEPRSKP